MSSQKLGINLYKTEIVKSSISFLRYTMKKEEETMTITIKRSFINVLLVFLSFLASSWFYKTYLISYAYYISNYGTDFAE